MVQQGQLLKAKKYFGQSQRSLAQQYMQQIITLEKAQQLFNQGKFATSLQQAQKVRQQHLTLMGIQKVAQQLVQINKKARQKKYLGPIPSNKLAQIDTTVAGQNIKAGILIDANSGQILWQKQAQQSLPVASLSKLLAVYTIYQTVQERHLSLKTSIKASAVINGIEGHEDLSTAKLQVGQYYTIANLLEATMIASANDAVMVLGQYLYGSQENFVQRMEQNAQQLHLTATTVVNANGLPITIDPSVANNPQTAITENQFSANDLAKVSQALLQKYPQILQISQQNQVQIGNQNFMNTNQLIPNAKLATNKYKVDGLKTGTGEAAGYGVIVTTIIHQKRLILVVLQAPSDEDRFSQARDLLDYVDEHWAPKLAVLPTYPHGKIQSIWQPIDIATQLQLQYQIELLKNPQRLIYTTWLQRSQIPELNK